MAPIRRTMAEDDGLISHLSKQPLDVAAGFDILISFVCNVDLIPFVLHHTSLGTGSHGTAYIEYVHSKR